MEWSEVEPVLDATYRLLADEEQTTQEAVCEAAGRAPGDERTIRALALLYSDGYIDGITVEESPAPIFISPTAKGLRKTSGWPSGAGEGERRLAVGAQGEPARMQTGNEFDVFVSHASEDKPTVARPLRDALVHRGFSVWLDEQELTLGDALGQKIDEGLARSRFGVVILSEHFFAKRWPRRELDGLVARETLDGQKVILPVWHGITSQEVTAKSPTLAARLAVDTACGIDHVAEEVRRALDAASGEGWRADSARTGNGSS